MKTNGSNSTSSAAELIRRKTFKRANDSFSDAFLSCLFDVSSTIEGGLSYTDMNTLTTHPDGTTRD